MLSDIVSDILNTNTEVFEDYIKNERKDNHERY